MNIPKINFQIMTLEENINNVKWMFYDDIGDFSPHYYTIQCFPELAVIDLNEPKSKVYKIIEQVVTKNYEIYKDKIISDVLRYNKLWNEYNDKYFQMLSDYFGVGLPENVKQIDAKIGIIPVIPRYLESFSFSLSVGLDDWKVIETSAHETLHFIWFEKWKKLYPDTPQKNYEAPFIEWEYSEMVTDPILNNAPFNDLFNFTERSYDYFYELSDNDELVMDNLRNIFASNDNIDKKIDDGFLYVKEILGKIRKL